jgi:hypothetical protein
MRVVDHVSRREGFLSGNISGGFKKWMKIKGKKIV